MIRNYSRKPVVASLFAKIVNFKYDAIKDVRAKSIYIYKTHESYIMFPSA